MQYRQRCVVVQALRRRAMMIVLRVAWRWAAIGINAQEPDCAPHIRNGICDLTDDHNPVRVDPKNANLDQRSCDTVR